MQGVSFDDEQLTRRSSASKAPTGITGFLVRHGMSSGAANVLLLVLSIGAIALSIYLLNAAAPKPAPAPTTAEKLELDRMQRAGQQNR